MLVSAVNPSGIARCRTLLAETSRRNAAAATDADEARRSLQVAAAIERPLYTIAIDLSDGRRFNVAFRGVTLSEALVRAIETYVPADAVDLVIGISAGRVDALPDRASLA